MGTNSASWCAMLSTGAGRPRTATRLHAPPPRRSEFGKRHQAGGSPKRSGLCHLTIALRRGVAEDWRIELQRLASEQMRQATQVPDLRRHAPPPCSGRQWRKHRRRPHLSSLMNPPARRPRRAEAVGSVARPTDLGRASADASAQAVAKSAAVFSACTPTSIPATV